MFEKFFFTDDFPGASSPQLLEVLSTSQQNGILRLLEVRKHCCQSTNSGDLDLTSGMYTFNMYMYNVYLFIWLFIYFIIYLLIYSFMYLFIYIFIN